MRVGYDVFFNGVYFSPTVGIRYKALDFGIGYTINRADIYYEYWWTANYTRGTVSSLTFKIGVRF